MYVVSGHLDSRVTDVLNGTSRRAGRRRRRLGCRHGARAGPRDGDPRVRRDDRLRRVLRRGAGHLRLGQLRGAGSRPQAPTSPACSRTTSSGARSARTACATGTTSASSRRARRPNETPQQAAIRRTMGGENDSPPRELARFVREAAEAAVPKMNVWIIYRRDRFLRGTDDGPFLDQGYPGLRMTEPNEDYRHEHQDVRVENGVQFGDLPQFVDFDYIANVARINAVGAGGARQRARSAARASRSRPRRSRSTRRSSGSRTPSPTSRATRSSTATRTHPYWTAHDPGGERDQLHGQGHHQGQLPLRRAGRRQGRQPQRRHLPRPEVSPPTGDGRPSMRRAPCVHDNRPMPVLAIFGPTASGKSAVAEEVARLIPAELVSADAMQVYRGLPILTNQSEARLVGYLGLDEEGSVAEYQRLAHAAMDEILAAGRTPVVVGGTGLYLRAALADLELPPPPAPGARERLEELLRRARRRERARAARRARPGGRGGRASERPPPRRARARARRGRLEPAARRGPALERGDAAPDADRRPRRPARGARAADRGAHAGDVRTRGRGGGAAGARRPDLADRAHTSTASTTSPSSRETRRSRRS